MVLHPERWQEARVCVPCCSLRHHESTRHGEDHLLPPKNPDACMISDIIASTRTTTATAATATDACTATATANATATATAAASSTAAATATANAAAAAVARCCCCCCCCCCCSGGTSTGNDDNGDVAHEDVGDSDDYFYTTLCAELDHSAPPALHYHQHHREDQPRDDGVGDCPKSEHERVVVCQALSAAQGGRGEA